MAQPPPSSLSLRGLLSLPYRLCNPPPAVGKVRSCAVTPVLDVRLDDVLSRRHLPPIGLKDLEEYLLYVEHAPENLYFVLWLKDYTARYQAWVQREKSSLVSQNDTRPSKIHRQKFAVPPTPDPSLAMFYLRAKQTFFTPNGEYELNIPSDILAPFHSTPHTYPLYTHPQDNGRPSLWHSQSVHPDPAVFTEVAIEARHMLNESLRHFVRAAYTNVGSRRAICGIVAGCAISLFAGLLPLLLTTGCWNVGPHGRLIRLVAFPGLWFGLTVLIASLQGICLMVYFFGDLRQLRKFELARPTISRPLLMPISPPILSASTTAHGLSLSMPSHSAPAASLTFSSLDFPSSFIAPARPYAQSSSTSLPRTSRESCESEGCSSVECNEIDISPAFFDDVPAPEGPATASCLHRPEYRLPLSTITYVEPAHVRPEGRSAKASISMPTPGNPLTVDPCHSTWKMQSMKSPTEYGPTAGFIPNDYSTSTSSTNSTTLCDTSRSLRSQGSACHFNFDLLPSGSVTQHHHGMDDGPLPVGGTHSNAPSSSSAVVDLPNPHSSTPAPSSSPSLSVVPFLGRAQYKCNRRTSPVFASPSFEKGSSPVLLNRKSRKKFSLTTLIPSFTAGVPAFAAPLTQVQSPAVKRAQWEVVVRAASVAAVIAGLLVGIVVGVVP